MPRPKKIKNELIEGTDNTNNNTIDDIINKMKNIYPEQTELIDQIVVNVKKNNKISGYIVVDKKDNYYMDDFNGVWNEKLELIGAYDNDKIYLYDNIKKIANKILHKK